MKHARDTEETLSKTRVCIKNLPPFFTESDLRSFLIRQLGNTTILTDCRILKHASGKSRRMAFCGFLKESQAAHCVERLDRSYCNTSRLVVEYAHLPARGQEHSGDAEKTKTAPRAGESADDENKKETESSEKLDRRKQEFLAVMGVGEASVTRKFWANDEEEEHVDHSPRPPESKAEDLSSRESDDSSTSSSSSSKDLDSEDDADPLQSQDLEFLKSKQVAIQDFESDDSAVPQPDPDEESQGSSSSESESEKSLRQQVDEEPTDSHTSLNTAGRDRPLYQETILVGSRLFLRNLPFSATEDDVRAHFQRFGMISECHIPTDDLKRNKGFGFVAFSNTADAQAAKAELDGTDFQGRILHILPARQAPSSQSDSNEQGLTYKEQMERKRRENALSDTQGWSASFVRGDAVVDNLASRLGLNKGAIMAVKDGLSAGDAAVRLALGETAVIEENRKYFARHGYDMDALVSVSTSDTTTSRSHTAILVKNLPHDTSKDELVKVFGGNKSILLPPSRTIAVVEYAHGNDAKAAFRRLAYRRFKSVPLYLEWAPLTSILDSCAEDADDGKQKGDPTDENNEVQDSLISGVSSTLHIKNLNFKTTEEQLHKLFSQYAKDVRSVRIPRKAAPVKRDRIGSAPSHSLSMGFGFVEYGSSESARKALKLLNGTMVDGNALELKPSDAGNKVAATPVKSGRNSAKLLVRNVPFQAHRKELLQLFGSFGQLKKVRLPKKFDGTNRGFAFVEYLTGKEAAAAMKSLSRTHLYGRHLVIEWAAEDEDTEKLELLREKAGRDVALPSQPKNKKIRFE